MRVNGLIKKINEENDTIFRTRFVYNNWSVIYISMENTTKNEDVE